jgi:hypothetical protein
MSLNVTAAAASTLLGAFHFFPRTIAELLAGTAGNFLNEMVLCQGLSTGSFNNKEGCRIFFM